ncbi:uncharacterized protein LOC143909875 [Arctopsyche grandis]|uniref:uncharacterized protein LOC143909875 n=1 Tax=Arctopsyche grandis TaxID=121162 RepID=UPI00406D7628
MLGYARRLARARITNARSLETHAFGIGIGNGNGWRHCAMAAALSELRAALPLPTPAAPASATPVANRVVAALVYAQRTSVAIDTDHDLEPLLAAIRECHNMEILELGGYSFGVDAAARLGELIGERGGTMKCAQWADIFVSRNKPEVPVALNSMISGILKSGAMLTVLNLSDNAFGALGLQSVVSYFKSPQAVHLQELYLNNNGLGISGAKVLSSALSSPPPNLRRLEIGRNRLENAGAIAVADILKKVSTLEQLSLPQNGIYFPGIEALAGALSKNKNLKLLNLNDNTVGPKGAKALLQILPYLKELRFVNLGDCLLKNQGAKLIFQALNKPNLPELESLDLSFNEISAQSRVELETALLWRCDIFIFLEGNRFSTSFKSSLNERANGELDFGKEGSDDEEDVDDEEEEDDEDEDDDEDRDVSQSTAEEDEIEKANISDLIKKNLLMKGTTITPVVINSDVTLFLNNPNKETFSKLGTKPMDLLLKHLQVITEDDVYADEIVQIIFKLFLVNQDPKEIYSKMKLWLDGNNCRLSLIANAFLVHLGFIKSETKNKNLAGNTDASVNAFANAIKTPAFSQQLRNMILFVIKDRCAKEKKIGNVDYSNHREFWSNGQ